MVGPTHFKLLHHAGMIGAEIIEGTVKVGRDGYRNGTTRSIERATADQGGGGVPIALPNHKWMAARYPTSVKW